jgi:hypothetical protein
MPSPETSEKEAKSEESHSDDAVSKFEDEYEGSTIFAIWSSITKRKRSTFGNLLDSNESRVLTVQIQTILYA